MKKTILYLITQSELGGAQRYVFDLAINLKQEFNVAVAFGEQGERGELTDKLKQAEIAYYTIPHLKRAISPINDFLAFIEIIKLIKKIKPDIIHLNSSKISILGSLAAKTCSLFRVPPAAHPRPRTPGCVPLPRASASAGKRAAGQACSVIYTVHGWVFNEPMPKWQKLFYKYAEKFTALFKDKIISVSDFDRQTAIKEKICDTEKLITIHNGIAPINFYPREEAIKIIYSKIENCKLKIENLLIGSIANLYKTKGLEYLIQAANIIKEKSLILNSKFLILIIGEGPERKNLEQLIKRHQLQNNIILTGRVGNAAELLPAFDIYACPSVKEGLSYTIIEAMQAGLPIIATNAGGNPELIKDGKTGLLTEIKNPQILAEKIMRLINNSDLSQSLGANAKEKAKNEFGLERMVEKTREVYL
ncbi:glycosyltransferase family 4 protein [Patescibacteria group bacterium]|nr:glycosyltransferase family 4 protein [Patescibacteria group bacterium]